MIVSRQDGDRSALSEREAEADLVRRCIAGDSTAHTEFYQTHRRRVAANLYRVMGRVDDVEDLLQEVFIIAFRSLSKFRAEARLSTWLYRIAVNVALGRIRKKGRRPALVSAETELIDTVRHSLGDAPPTPAAQLLQKHERQRVYRILDQLGAKKRMVLYLHEIEGLELKEIAYLLDTLPVTIRTRLYYARREFYKLLAADDPEVRNSKKNKEKKKDSQP